jgi:hypothetical protein
MVDVPVPLILIAFLLGAAFLYLGLNYLNVSHSQSLYSEAQDHISLANLACSGGDYDNCLNNLLSAESRLIEARSKLNPYDSSTAAIYYQIEDSVNQVDVLLAFVYFSKKIETEVSLREFNIVGSKGDSCEIKQQAQKLLDDLEELEPDVDTIRALIDDVDLLVTSKQKILETLNIFEANKEMIEVFEPALDATCTVKTEIEPRINPDDDAVTVINLKEDPRLQTVKNKLEESLLICHEFVDDKEKSTLVNFTIGECSWIENNLDSVSDLIEFVSTQELIPTEGFTASKLFVTLKDYSDLVTLVDPLNDDIRVLAIQIAREHPGGASVEQAEAIFKYVRDDVVYLLPPLTQHQRVQRPEATLQLKAGNCADKSVFAASLYMAVGYQVKAVLQDRFHTPDQVEAGAPFTPDHMFIRVRIGDEWYDAEVTCSNCPFNTYTSINSSTLLEMDIPIPT